jgi:uncharacterized membrane protein YdfJ with MMPL/SSD domain
VRIKLLLDPFSPDGQQFIDATRHAIERVTAEAQARGRPIGTMRLVGLGGEQLDASRQTFDALPLVMGATLAIVCAILALAFRALLVPLRAVLCLVWVLLISMGAALFVYQVA